MSTRVIKPPARFSLAIRGRRVSMHIGDEREISYDQLRAFPFSKTSGRARRRALPNSSYWRFAAGEEICVRMVGYTVCAKQKSPTSLIN